MTEEDPIFDPTKKKKKKKKVPFDLDGSLGETEAPAEDTKQDGVEEEKEIKIEVDEFDLSSLKKKKKKKKNFDLADLGEALPAEEKTQDSVEGETNTDALPLDDDLDFSLTKKKKKKKNVKLEDLENEDDTDGSNNKTARQSIKVDSDRDYTYAELLKRAIQIMAFKNPEMVAGEKKKFVMKPPVVNRVGTKKTSFTNFAEICKMLHRQQKHLLAFLLAELGTSGSVDGSNQLIIKGRFSSKQIENVLRRYIKEYVTCHTCKSPDTILQKETRLFFLQCESCCSKCSVASIKSGFQAFTGKRAAVRAKTS